MTSQLNLSHFVNTFSTASCSTEQDKLKNHTTNDRIRFQIYKRTATEMKKVRTLTNFTTGSIDNRQLKKFTKEKTRVRNPFG